MKKTFHKYVYDNNDKLIKTAYYSLPTSAAPVVTADPGFNNRILFDRTSKPGSIIVQEYLTAVQIKYFDEYILNAKQRVSRINYVGVGGDYSLLTYDDKGNLLNNEIHVGGDIYTFVYNYDQHKGIFNNNNDPIVMLDKPTNNVIHMNASYTGSFTPHSNDTVISYTYNSDDMPVTSTEVKRLLIIIKLLIHVHTPVPTLISLDKTSPKLVQI